MKRQILHVAITALATMSLNSSMAAFADVAGRHPDYLQILTNLKTAKSLMAAPDTPNAQADEINSVQEVDACLHDVMEAAVVDGKNVAIAPPADAGTRGARLIRALELLGKAQSLLLSPEDDVNSLKMQVSAQKHLTQAIDFCRKANIDDQQHK